ncbi:MAG: DUF2059 domain-containing protein [Candidatus Omnitrophota bacterium]
MIKRTISVSFFISIFVLGASLCSAEVLHLKNGKKIEGQLIERQKNYVKIMVKGVPFMYFTDEIQKIDSDKQPQPQEESLAALRDKPFRALEAIPAGKRELISRFLQLNGSKESMNFIFSDILSRVPADKVDHYKDLFRVDEILEGIMPVYDKYYTEDELRELVKFYGSPVGKKLIEVNSSLLRETMDITLLYFQQLIPATKKKK